MAIFCILVGFIILGISLYIIIKTKQLNKKGVKIIATVVNCEKIEKKLNDKTVELGYNTTFSLEYKGDIYEETLKTSKSYEVGSNHKGTYIHNGKQGNLYLEKEGIFNGSIQSGLLVLYLSGIPFLLALIFAAPVNQEISFAILFIYILAFVIGISLAPNTFSRFKYDDPQSAKGVSLKEFFKIIEKPNKDDENIDKNELDSDPIKNNNKDEH